MHRPRCLVVIGALAAVACVGAAGPALAAKGGNNVTANLCQQGGWKALLSRTGGAFANQGDCVNDGAQGLGVVSSSAGQTACGNLPGSTFISGSDSTVLWLCEYPATPNPGGQSALQTACDSDAGVGLDFRVRDSVATGLCFA